MSKLESFLYSESSGIRRKKAVDYLSKKIARPDKGSDFDRSVGIVKYFFRIPVFNKFLTGFGLSYLERKGYDSLMGEYSGEIVGHLAFQNREEGSLHIFSIGVLPEYRGRGFAKKLLEDILHIARKRGIRMARVGAGGNSIVNYLHSNLKNKQDELGLLVRGGNWVEFL